MTAMSIRELHEHTDLWVHRVTEEEPIVVKDNGRPIARIVAIPAPIEANPFLTRQLLPGFAQLQSSLSGGTDITSMLAISPNFIWRNPIVSGSRRSPGLIL
jgi:antitoxin (DNA-binding transcriptional repressor) of toxin-antitoxin stability system